MATLTHAFRVFSHCLPAWFLILAAGPAAFARQADSTGAVAAAINGPPPPAPPAMVARDAEGRVTMRAIRLTAPLVLDGRLDDEIYTQVPPVGDFVQQEPREGDPATERTDVWVFFDARNVYVVGRMWDSRPDQIVANEMRRDSRNIFLNDNFGVAIDTFYNQRSGFFFQTNPLGGLRDALVADEEPNYDWDGVWDVRTSRFEEGWIAEMAFPFKTLRFEGGGTQIWGINFRRVVRSKNEMSLLSRVPASYGSSGITRFSRAATLVGIEPPTGYRNLEIKPYGISEVVTNREADPPVSNDLDGELGLDVKYGLTRSLIADFTVNTDFAQVENDEQQVNLTRFSLFFPEKREFFLEGQGIFEFAGVNAGSNNAPVLFFSRRIGLERGQTVPILAGGRMTGRAGAFDVGLLNIQTGDSEAVGADSTNFTVVRVRRDVLRRSNVGVLFTRRGPTTDGSGSNEVYGLDGNFRLLQDIHVNTYYARTSTPGFSGDEDSYMGSFNYDADRYGVEARHLKIGDNFNPEIGFLRREDFRQTSGGVRFSPRPQSLPAIRKFQWDASIDYITNLDGLLETRQRDASFEIQFENSDVFQTGVADVFEFLPEPFEIDDDITLPIGGYGYREFNVRYQLGPQRRVSGAAEVIRGSFYSGNRTAAEYSGRVEVSPRLAFEPRVELNWVDLPEGEFTTRLVATRATFTLSPRMFVGALVQYNSSNDSLTSNVRFRWEYQPGSDIFVVYSEGRDTLDRDPRTLLNRGVVVKVTRLLRL